METEAEKVDKSGKVFWDMAIAPDNSAVMILALNEAKLYEETNRIRQEGIYVSLLSHKFGTPRIPPKRTLESLVDSSMLLEAIERLNMGQAYVTQKLVPREPAQFRLLLDRNGHPVRIWPDVKEKVIEHDPVKFHNEAIEYFSRQAFESDPDNQCSEYDGEILWNDTDEGN